MEIESSPHTQGYLIYIIDIARGGKQTVQGAWPAHQKWSLSLNCHFVILVEPDMEDPPPNGTPNLPDGWKLAFPAILNPERILEATRDVEVLRTFNSEMLQSLLPGALCSI